MLTRNIERLRQQLPSIALSIPNQMGAHLYSNDQGLPRLIPSIETQVGLAHPKLEDTIGVGLVIGTGKILTIAPRLPRIKFWVGIDIDPAVTSWMTYLVPVVANAEDRNCFKKQLLSQPIYLGGLEEEAKSDDPYHFLSSEETFVGAQKFAAEDKAAFIVGDISDRPFTNSLARILRENQCSIVFANMTNVAEWISESEEMEECLKQLPFSRDCTFLYSQSGTLSFLPKHKLVSGLSGYIDCAVYTRNTRSKRMRALYGRYSELMHDPNSRIDSNPSHF